MTAAEALGCQSCGLPITPCLVCASPLPVSQADDALIKTCRSCGVVNPLGDKYREVLDIAPASALPSGMVRRAQITRVGRRPYVLAKHAHFMHLSSVVSERKGEDGQDKGSESQGLAIQEIFARLGPKGSPVPEVFASAEEGHPLTFLPYMQDTGARMHQEAVRSGRKAMDTRRFYPYSDSESPVKRMSVTVPCHSLPGGSRRGRR